LWQQGAQKLAELYGFSHRFEWVEVIKDWKEMFFYFEIRCILKSRRSGDDIGEGIGSCNSKESKYAYRWAFKSDVPAHLDLSKILKKEFQSKAGKPYFKFRIDNDDIASQVNTLQKMAAKRAYVHAVISVTRSSGLFTQDAEDLPEEAFGVVDEERSWERSAVDPIDEAIRTKDQKKEAEKSPTSEGIRPSEQASNAPNPEAVRDQGTRQTPANDQASVKTASQGDGGERPASKIDIKMPTPAAKSPPKAKPTASDVPFGNPEQERATGPLPSPVDWPKQVDQLKGWISEAYQQAEPGPRNTVADLVKRFCEGPPFPPAEVAEELKRFLKMMAGTK
jgi:hypothetical protein